MKLFTLGLMVGVYSMVYFGPAIFAVMRSLAARREEERIRHEDLVAHIAKLTVATRDNQLTWDFRGAL